ncbi:host attachment protein [Prosthecobacter sp. SYSU 5D2]|uniref:host attachment protein n=1 Tax=Prosthecobacter sp. SYSU 5D2 TaxID=3134134 RepID=UPI0031FE9509
MKKLPSLLVVTDRGHFHAYQSDNGASLVALDNMQISEALDKLSEQVTDQAGAFPSRESHGEGNSTGERLPLLEELEQRSIRQIGQRIEELMVENEFKNWGLIAAAEINNAILDQVAPATREKLAFNLKRNLAGQPTEELRKRVLED